MVPADAARLARVPMVNGQLMPEDFDGIQRLAMLMMQTGMLPRGCDKPAQAILLTAKAYELGIPFTQIPSGMMIVNNRPTVWGDLALALVMRSPECAGVIETTTGSGETAIATCTAKRCKRVADGTFAITETARTFSAAEAKKAGLWGKSGPWSSYPMRMLQMRARAFAIRDAFPDLLGGIGITEEVEDFAEVDRNARRVENQTRAKELTGDIDALKPTPVGKPAESQTANALPPELARLDDPPSNDPPKSDPEDAALFAASLGLAPTPVSPGRKL